MPVFNAWVCCFYYISLVGRCILAYLLLSHKIKCKILSSLKCRYSSVRKLERFDSYDY